MFYDISILCMLSDVRTYQNISIRVLNHCPNNLQSFLENDSMILVSYLQLITVPKSCNECSFKVDGEQNVIIKLNMDFKVGDGSSSICNKQQMHLLHSICGLLRNRTTAKYRGKTFVSLITSMNLHVNEE